MTITADIGDRRTSVLLHVRGPVDDEQLCALRRQLAACLSSGVTHLSVQVDDDLDAEALQALHGAGAYLRRRGGELTLVRARQEQLA